MKIAISNIAWDVDEDEVIAKLLQRYNVRAIDIAPVKYFPVPEKATEQDVTNVKDWWAKHGIKITGMQSLFFGTTGLNVFGSIEIQEKMLNHLASICNIAAQLGAQRLVFGAPKNRDRTGLNDQEAMEIAVNFFKRLGDIAQKFGVIICLEPNPSCYGANFMNTSAETAALVKQVSHQAIKMQFDTGAITINKEDPFSILKEYYQLIGHIHASETDLLPLGDGSTDYRNAFTAIKTYLPNHLISIEMVATKNESHEISIERSLNTLIKNYSSETDSKYRASWQVPNFETIFWSGRKHPWCVVIPVINEGERIKNLLSSMSALGISNIADIIIIDSGSTDGSLQLEYLQKNCVSGLLVKTGPGKLSAQLRCAYSFSLDRSYKGIITIDGNNKDNPEAIPRFIEGLKNDFDFIQASRFVQGGVAENTPMLRDFAIRFIHAPMLSIFSGFKWTDSTQGFRAYSSKMLLDSRLAIFRDVFNTYELLAYMSYRVPKLKFRCLEMPAIRTYPKGETPTKISAFRGNLEVLKILFRACFKKYDQ